MKNAPMIIGSLIFGGIVVAYFLFFRGRGGSLEFAGVGSGGGGQSSDVAGAQFDSLTSGASAGGSLPTTEENAAATIDAQRAEIAAESLATGETIPSGFFINPFNSPYAEVPIFFEKETTNPVTKQAQRIFSAASGSFDDPVNQIFGGVFQVPGTSPAPFEPGDRFFVEALPTGAGSIAQNVIQTGAVKHSDKVVTAPDTLKPGDPGYDVAVATVRQMVLQAREPPKPTTKVASSSKSLGDQILERAKANSGSSKRDNTSSPAGKPSSAASSTGTKSKSDKRESDRDAFRKAFSKAFG